MKENCVPEINVDEVMGKIRAEANRHTLAKEKFRQSSPGADLASEKVPLFKINHLSLEFSRKT